MSVVGFSSAPGIRMVCARTPLQVSTVSSNVNDCMEKATSTKDGVFFIIAMNMDTAEIIVANIERELGYSIRDVELLDSKCSWRITLRNESLIYVVTEQLYKRLVGRKKTGTYDMRNVEVKKKSKEIVMKNNRSNKVRV